MPRPVYLRSLSCLSAAAPGPPPLAAAELPAGASLPAAGWIHPMPRPAGPRVPRFGRLDRLAQLGLLVACEAVATAGAPPLRDAQPPAGIALGTWYGSHLSNELFWRGQRGPTGPSPAIFAYTLPSAAAAEVSMHFGLKGPSLTLTGAADSGLCAFAVAAAQVAGGWASGMLAAAADVLSPSLLCARAEAGGLEEGAACALLDAEPAGALARLAGAGQASGAGAGERALAAALERAGLARAELRRVLGPAEVREASGLAAAPLLAAAAPLLAGELPLLLLAGDDRSATALCWTVR
jgi:hypothetical protein